MTPAPVPCRERATLKTPPAAAPLWLRSDDTLTPAAVPADETKLGRREREVAAKASKDAKPRKASFGKRKSKAHGSDSSKRARSSGHAVAHVPAENEQARTRAGASENALVPAENEQALPAEVPEGPVVQEAQHRLGS